MLESNCDTLIESVQQDISEKLRYSILKSWWSLPQGNTYTTVYLNQKLSSFGFKKNNIVYLANNSNASLSRRSESRCTQR